MFQCQLIIWRIWKGRQIDPISYWAAICCFSPVKTDKFRLWPSYPCAEPRCISLGLCCYFMVAQSSKIMLQQHQASSLWLGFFFPFLSCTKIWANFFFVCIGLYLFNARDYTRTCWSLKEFFLMFMVSHRTIHHFFFLKMKYKSVGTCQITVHYKLWSCTKLSMLMLQRSLGAAPPHFYFFFETGLPQHLLSFKCM